VQAPESVLRNRPNKLAKGMTVTFYRQGIDRLMRKYAKPSESSDARTLSVRGTLDVLGTSLSRFEKAPCGSCGCKCRGQLRLNDAGRRRLRALRAARG